MSGAQSQIVQYLQSRGINPTNANMAAVLPALNTNPDIIPGLREQGLVAMEPIVSQGDPGFVGPPTAPQRARRGGGGSGARGVGDYVPPVPPGEVNAVQDVGDDPPIVNPRSGVTLGQQIATNTPPNTPPTTPPTQPPDPSKLTMGEGLSAAALAAALGIGGAFGAKKLLQPDATQQSQMPPAQQQSTAQQAAPQQSKAQTQQSASQQQAAPQQQQAAPQKQQSSLFKPEPNVAGPVKSSTQPFKPITLPNLDDPEAVKTEIAKQELLRTMERSRAASAARGMPPAGARGGRGALPPVIEKSMPGFKGAHIDDPLRKSLQDELSVRGGLKLY